MHEMIDLEYSNIYLRKFIEIINCSLTFFFSKSEHPEFTHMMRGAETKQKSQVQSSEF